MTYKAGQLNDQELRDLFNGADSNKDGYLSSSELRQVLERFRGSHVTAKQSDLMVIFGQFYYYKKITLRHNLNKDKASWSRQ